MNKERLVLILREHLVEEGAAGTALLIENVTLAPTGVDEQAEGEREIGFLGKILDGFGAAVLLKSEVVFGEIFDDLACLSRTVTGRVTTLTSTEMVATESGAFGVSARTGNAASMMTSD